jgi:hypothetical protein
VRFMQGLEAGTLPASLLMGFITLLAGCGVQVPSTPADVNSTLICADFETNVFPILHTPLITGRSCADVGCHISGGTTGGGFKIDPTAVAGTQAMQDNYQSALKFSNLLYPRVSPLLLKPLNDASVNGHGGSQVFSGTSDVNYLVFLAWISNQIPGQVPDTCP